MNQSLRDSLIKAVKSVSFYALFVKLTFNALQLSAQSQMELYENYKPKLKAFFEVSFSSQNMRCIFVAIQDKGEITTLTLLKSSDKFESFKERIFADAKCENCALAKTFDQVEDPVEMIYNKLEAGQVYIVYKNEDTYKLEQYLDKGGLD